MRTGFAKDFTEAADLIVAGSQSGLNVSEDWLDTVNEYSTQFRKLGITGPEALGLLSQAVKGGARDTDVAADAIKEFSIRAIDGSKSTMGAFHSLGLDFEATTAAFAKGGPAAHDMFQTVLRGIQQIQDPYEKAQVQVALFGTQSEDLGDALNRLDLSNAVQQIGDVGGAAQRASDTIGGNSSGSVQSAMRTLEIESDKVQQSLATAFGPLVNELATFVTSHKSEIIDFFTTLGSAAIDFGQAVLTGVSVAAGNLADLADILGLDDWADSLHGIEDGAHDAGEALQKGQDDLKKYGQRAQDAAKLTDGLSNSVKTLATTGDNVTIDVKDNTPEVDAKLKALGIHLQTFEDDPTKMVLIADTDPAKAILDAYRGQENNTPITPPVKPDLISADAALQQFRDQWKNQGIVLPVVVPPPASPPPASATSPFLVPPGRAGGGLMRGPGTGTSDSIPAWLSDYEFVVNADATRKNLPLLQIINSGKIPGFSTGGLVGPDVSAAMDLLGTAYSKANRTDCSGMVARVINAALGTGGGLMTTKNAQEWLAARGFQPGIGGPGTISVGWYDHGPGANDGHMAMTLSDGTNAEAGGKNGVFTIGAGAQGASSPQFDHHMFLPNLFGEGLGGSSSGGYSGGGAVGIGPGGESGTYSAPDAKAVREANEKVADADQRVRQAELKVKELDADAKESQRQAAQADLDKAKREAADARADLAEVQKGKFTPGKSGGSGGGLGFKLPSAFSGLASIGLDGMGITTQVSPNTPERTFEFGNALGAAVGGQVSSALDVFGVGDSPPWLQAISKFVGGISIGGKSAAPIAAGGSGGGVAPPDGAAHGLQAGQPPGPTYNIRTATVEDAFLQAQRLEDQRALAKLPS
jgi:hypothetical protein